MRTSFAVAAGLVAVASAGTTTITDTVDVTITSCAPSVTNCPYKGGNGADPTWSDWSVSASTTKAVSPTGTWDPTWSDWVSSTTKPVSPDSTGSWDPTWSDWTGAATTPVSPATTPAACGAYTATAPPAWFSLLPSDSYSSLQAKWSGAPPSDWCYYTYSASSLYTAVTPVAAASTSSAAWASYGGSSTGVSPATFTGAANANTGSFALVGLAAAAALVMA